MVIIFAISVARIEMDIKDISVGRVGSGKEVCEDLEMVILLIYIYINE